jgi:hypothetical protein
VTVSGTLMWRQLQPFGPEIAYVWGKKKLDCMGHFRNSGLMNGAVTPLLENPPVAQPL